MARGSPSLSECLSILSVDRDELDQKGAEQVKHP